MFLEITCYASSGEMDQIISKMKGVESLPSDANGSRVTNTINNVIGLIQLAGTGISLIVITLLGIKYILASPSEKADTKKQIMPILIGCILLFGAVNIVGIMVEASKALQ